jgi:predicted PolB exonuclease-like 3'-5' exonuclease
MRYAIDIETVGLPEAANYAEPVAAPANYKDPEKIAAYIAERQAEQVNRAGLDLDLCRIVAIGLLPERETAVRVFTAPSPHDEKVMLIDLWDYLTRDRHPVLVGFNMIGFDLPVLIRRSQYLGVVYPRMVLDRYRTPHEDLMLKLTWNGLVKARSLKFYAKRFGIPVEDEVSGADIAGLVEAGDWDKVISHVTSDVRLTAALAERIGVLKVPAPELDTDTQVVA